MSNQHHLADADVLVTGGAGFIGSHISSMLVDLGADVSIVDNYSKGRSEFVPETVDSFELDIRSTRLIDVVTEIAPEYVVHLAAHHYVPYCNEHPAEAYDVNVMGTRNLLDACETIDSLKRLVFASTGAVYPPRETPHSESDDVDPVDTYGRTKVIGEDLVTKFHYKTEIDTVSLRLFNVYGPNETNPHLIPAIIEQLENGNRTVELGNLSPQRDFVHVADVVDAVAVALTEVAGGNRSYNVGTGNSYSVREVVEAIGEALGKDIEIIQEEERVRESDRPHLCADPSLLKQKTSWDPTVTLVEGLQRLSDNESD
jgi:UDP-glucose 4-epimerase